MSSRPDPRQAAYRAGMRSGIASVLGFGVRRRPPVRVRRKQGSLRDDARAIARDGQRIVHVRS